MTRMKIVISFPKSVGFVNRDKRHTFLMVKILSKSLKHGGGAGCFYQKYH